MLFWVREEKRKLQVESYRQEIHLTPHFYQKRSVPDMHRRNWSEANFKSQMCEANMFKNDFIELEFHDYINIQLMSFYGGKRKFPL